MKWQPTGILAWRIPRTEEPGGLQPLGSQRVRHNLATNFHPRSGSFNRRDRGQTQGTAIHWASACHGSIRDDAPEMQARRSAEQQHRWTPKFAGSHKPRWPGPAREALITQRWQKLGWMPAENVLFYPERPWAGEKQDQICILERALWQKCER